MRPDNASSRLLCDLRSTQPATRARRCPKRASHRGAMPVKQSSRASASRMFTARIDGTLRTWRTDGTPGPLAIDAAHDGAIPALAVLEHDGEPIRAARRHLETTKPMENLLQIGIHRSRLARLRSDVGDYACVRPSKCATYSPTLVLSLAAGATETTLLRLTKRGPALPVNLIHSVGSSGRPAPQIRDAVLFDHGADNVGSSNVRGRLGYVNPGRKTCIGGRVSPVARWRRTRARRRGVRAAPPAPERLAGELGQRATARAARAARAS